MPRSLTKLLENFQWNQTLFPKQSHFALTEVTTVPKETDRRVL